MSVLEKALNALDEKTSHKIHIFIQNESFSLWLRHHQFWNHLLSGIAR